MKLRVTKIDPNMAGTFRATCKRAENVLAWQVLKDTSPFVPMRNGILNINSGVEDNVVYYRTPYARFLYYGKLMVDPATGSAWARAGATKVLTDKDLVFSTAAHAQAQSHWMEASLAMNKDKWRRVAAKAVKKYGTT